MPHSYFDELRVVFVGCFRDLHQGTLMKRERFRMGLMTGTNVEKVTRTGSRPGRCPLVFFNFRDEEYRWSSAPDAPRNSFFFDVEGERADRMEAMLRKDFPEGFLPCRDPAAFRMILEDMQDSFFHYRPQRPFRLALFAEQFLTQIYSGWAAGQSGGKYENRIRETVSMIRRDPGAKRDFSRYAADLGITLIHYRRVFKAVMGLSPCRYQQKCRLTEAIRLLKSSKELQIQEVASLCGFQDPTEFSRFFRKETGLSPQNYCRTFFE